MKDLQIRTEGLTLEIEGTIAAPRGAVWRCWTEPELFKRWYCPKPWSVTEADFALQPGGRMRCVMQGPDGERIEVAGIWLEILAGERLTFTDSYHEGFLPREKAFMTGFLRLADAPAGGTRFVWGARHVSEADKQRHLEMGFEAGWPAAAAQLEELARSIAGEAGSALTFGAKVRSCLFLETQAEEAARFYVSLLPDSAIEAVQRPDPEGPPLLVVFTLAGAPYMTLNGNPAPASSHFASISVRTEDQAETDRLWQALTGEGGEEGRCGWLVDRFGVHWQIVPEALPRLMQAEDPAAAGRVSAALMQMKKIEVARLEAAARGE